MTKLLIIARKDKTITELHSGLTRNGFGCAITPHGNGLEREIAARRPDLVMVEVDDYLANGGAQILSRVMEQETSPPVLTLVHRDKIDGLDSQFDVDDFIIIPCDSRELVLRINRLLRHKANDSFELFECDGLVIDSAKCEVAVDGQPVEISVETLDEVMLTGGHHGALAENRSGILGADRHRAPFSSQAASKVQPTRDVQA